MKKIPLNEFMKRQQTKKTRTVLAPFLDDILTLKKGRLHGSSHLEIPSGKRCNDLAAKP